MTKQSRLAIRNPDFCVRDSNGTTIKCPGPAEIDHSKAGTVRFSDVYCKQILKAEGPPINHVTQS
jgi:hypothetical protein